MDALSAIDASEAQFTGPLVRDAEAITRRHADRVHVVLLGSIATAKYVRPLPGVFGAKLLFPGDFIGRGDMSRGALMLRAARDGQELAYEPLEGACRRGPEPQASAGPAVTAAAGSPDSSFYDVHGRAAATFRQEGGSACTAQPLTRAMDSCSLLSCPPPFPGARAKTTAHSFSYASLFERKMRGSFRSR